MMDRLPQLLIFYPVLLFSLSCHEAAHGWMADKFGDSTARILGRVTLNPFPHLDIIGTVMLPIIAILTGAPLIGWGKPVPVNPLNLKNPRKDGLWIAALGPISNIVVAIFFAGAGRVELLLLGHLNNPAAGLAATAAAVIYAICHLGLNLNLALAIFNMIPLYPLDGGGVVRGLLPYKALTAYDGIARHGMLVLLVLVVTGWLGFIFTPVSWLARILLPI